MAYQVIPISLDGKDLTIAMASVDNFRAVDDLQLLMGFKVRATVADEEQVARYLKEYYGSSNESVTNLVEEIASDEKLALLDGRGESIDLDAVLEAAEDNQVVHLLNLVLLQAIKDRRRTSTSSRSRRVQDAVPHRRRAVRDGPAAEAPGPRDHEPRIKVMANLDIAERRLPQDGRIELTVGGNPVDLRVAVLPTMLRRVVVMRVLDRSNTKLSLDRSACGTTTWRRSTA
jgi:type IV pilus assembly protein PilB